jgi:hypothetical protein
MTAEYVEGRHRSFTRTEEALTEGELQSRFASTMHLAIEQFARDPSYLVEIANSARTIERRRERRKAVEPSV